VLGFRVRYARPAERFVLLERDGAQLMIEQPLRQDRLFPQAELAHPYGRGASFEIEVDDVDALHAAVTASGCELILALEQRSYDRGADVISVRQFAVADPDGYLLRCSQELARHDRDN